MLATAIEIVFLQQKPIMIIGIKYYYSLDSFGSPYLYTILKLFDIPIISYTHYPFVDKDNFCNSKKIGVFRKL